MSAQDGTTTHLLVVDDEEDIVDLARRYFGQQGFRVTVANGGDAMRRVIAQERVDLVLLDLALPGESGIELTRYLRERSRIPVIIISGHGDAIDRVVALELGADDYVSKPFDLRELLARIRSVLRRSREQKSADADAPVRFAGFVLDRASRQLAAPDGKPVHLTTGEFDLLAVFADNPNRVLSRDDLIGKLHGRDAGPFDRSIDMQVARLRRKIEDDPADPRIIKSVRGIGYVFAAHADFE